MISKPDYTYMLEEQKLHHTLFFFCQSRAPYPRYSILEQHAVIPGIEIDPWDEYVWIDCEARAWGNFNEAGGQVWREGGYDTIHDPYTIL